MPTDIVNSPNLTSQDRRQEERRCAPRIPIPQGVPLTAEVETPNRVLRGAQCINLSPQGTLLDFGEGKCPRWEKNSKLSVILKLAGEVAKIPGVVRHRTDSRIGLSFNLNVLEQSPKDELAFSSIIRILERAVDRRTSSPMKGQAVIQTDQPTPAGSAKKNDTQSVIPEPRNMTQDRRGHERRMTLRISILPGIPLSADVVTPDRILRTVRCVDAEF